jgi:hypothetical protein
MSARISSLLVSRIQPSPDCLIDVTLVLRWISAPANVAPFASAVAPPAEST